MGVQDAAKTIWSEARDGTIYWTLSFYLPALSTGARRADAPVDLKTARLRAGVEPLFNDIADRSRPGRLDGGQFGRTVFDRLFSVDLPGAAGPPRGECLTLLMPARIRWTTEGRTYAIDVPERLRARKINLRRFWYQYGNGALSWHLSFDYCYANDLVQDSGGVPITFYFLSLLQKLAWPKESYRAPGQHDVDDLIGVTVCPEGVTTQQGFWAFVEQCFGRDCAKVTDMCTQVPFKTQHYPATLLQPSRLIEAPDIRYYDNRSLFFIHDEALFNLIQPVDDGILVKRRQRIPDPAFREYPRLIKQLAQSKSEEEEVELDQDYWQTVRAIDGNDGKQATQLAYLFLAGFNQNIIDFMNQEASEVLDSLDPIYPNSQEQEEEGFFVRYANPRALITYAPRSRSLEVGNDYIGTCPYAFLIHALAMHNEALIRQQETVTYQSIERIRGLIHQGSCAATSAASAKHFDDAEDAINQVRVNAFEVFDKHRYANPFRYDTERDVFEALDRLRGTSRLRASHEAAITAMEEQARDLTRRRTLASDRAERTADQGLTILFGVLGASGVIQALFAAYAYFYPASGKLTAFQQIVGVIFILGPVVATFAFLRRIRRRMAQSR